MNGKWSIKKHFQKGESYIFLHLQPHTYTNILMSGNHTKLSNISPLGESLINSFNSYIFGINISTLLKERIHTLHKATYKCPVKGI